MSDPIFHDHHDVIVRLLQVYLLSLAELELVAQMTRVMIGHGTARE